MTTNEFLAKLKKDCNKKGVTLKLVNKERIPYDRKKTFFISGYFVDYPKPTLACAIKKPVDMWLPILLHESCHMDQWSEGSKVWTSQLIDGIDSGVMFDEWLLGEDFKSKEIDTFIKAAQLLELDCEKRTVEKIKKLKLPIDIKNYIQKSNAYLFSYSAIRKTRVWPDKSPYSNKEIVDMMPTKFLKLEDYTNIERKLFNLIKTKCYDN